MGFSLRRTLMLGGILLGGLGFLGYALILYKNKKTQSYWLDEIKRKLFFTWLLPVSFAITLITWCPIFLVPFLKLHIISADLYTRSLPILTWACLIGWQTLIFIPLIFFKKENTTTVFQPWKEKSFLFFSLVLILVFIFIVLSRLGVDPIAFSITDLATPLLEGQLWFVLGLAFMLIWLKRIITHLDIYHNENNSFWMKYSDQLILIGLWIIGMITWMSQPLPQTNYFATKPLPPNYETYPFSDASMYDLNSMKVIYGATAGQIITKPAQVTFLALLHLIGGKDYGNIVLLQTLLLALFPPILYLIGKKIFNPYLGIILALFAILRELTSVQAVDIANVSNTKLLLSEPITTLLIALIVLLTVQWIRNTKRQIGQSLILGSVLGLMTLVRIQILFIFPVFFLVGLIKYFRNWKEIFRNLGGLMIGFGVVSFPIIFRNYSITGSIWFENPAYIGIFEDFYVTSGGSGINLFQSLNTVVGNFLHSCISTFLIFPVRLGTVDRVVELVTISQTFWAKVPVNFHFLDILIILVNLCIVAFGMSWLWCKKRMVCILLLGIFIFYNLSSAVFNVSGWRFILPVDWLIYIFYGLGMLEIFNFFIRKTFGRELFQSETYQAEKGTSPVWIVGLIVVMVLFASAISLRELLFPSVYPDLPKNQLCQEVLGSASQSNVPKVKENFKSYCLAEDTMVVKGLAFFPVFLEAGDSLRNNPTDIFFGPQTVSRLVFSLVSNGFSGNIIYPIHHPPAEFPNEAEVIVIGDLKVKHTAHYIYFTKSNTLIQSDQ